MNTSSWKQVPQVLEVVPADEPAAIDVVAAAEEGHAPWAQDIRGVGLDFALRAVFFLTAPFFVSLFCYMLQQYFLVVLMVVTVALTGLIGNPAALLHRLPCLRRIALVGDALRIFVRLRLFYFSHRPRGFLYYVFYPVTCPVALLFSRDSRQEFRLFSGILLSILAAMATAAVLEYRTTYAPHIPLSEATGELIGYCLMVGIIYFVFFTSLVTTSFTYHLSGRRTLLRILLVLGVLSALPCLVILWQERGRLGFRPDMLVRSRLKKPSFRAELREATAMFLLYEQERLDPSPDLGAASTADLTRKLQKHLAGLAPGDESQAYQVFTLPARQGAGDHRVWLGVKTVFQYSDLHPPQVIALIDPQRALHTSWHTLPPAIQRALVTAWEAGEKHPISAPRDVERKETLIDDLK